MGAPDPDPIPLFGLGVTHKSAPANAQKRVNVYYELQEDPDRSRVVAYGTPGLETFLDLTTSGVRGAIAPPKSTYAYMVHGSTFYQVDSAGTSTSRGTIATSSGRVAMAENGRYVVVVDGTAGYYFDMNDPSTGIVQIADGNFPNGARTIAWVDGYFIAALEGLFYLSDPNTPVTWPGDFASAESSPDNILLVVEDHQDLTIFGAQSIEFWANTGDPDFPFERIPGTTAEWGLAAINSAAPFDESVAFMARNELGQVVAAKLQGHRVVRLSNHELEAHWTSLGGIPDATAYSYMLDGHPFYVVNVGGETWMYDGAPPNAWTQLKSSGLTRHRGELAIAFNNTNYVADYDNGKVYKLRSDVYTDAGDPILRTLVGRHVFDGMRAMRISAFQLDIETGVGLATGQGSDPQAMLRISRDGGRTWGPSRQASFGKIGEFTKRCLWRRCGRGRDFTFEVSISDPVKVAIAGAAIKPRMRRG